MGEGFENYLKGIFENKKKKNPSYSLRAFARDLEVSHTYLSLIFSGKKKLPAQKIIKIAEKTSIPSEAVVPYLQSLKTNTLQRKKPERYLLAEKSSFALLKNWYYLSLLDLTLLKTFKPDEKWISNELGISRTELKKAVQILTRLGLLQIDKNQWKKTDKKIFFATRGPKKEVKQYHQKMILKGVKNLNTQNPRIYKRRDITGITMPINSKRLDEAKKKIQFFRRSLYEFLSQGDCDSLYQLNIQLFPLTKGNK